MFLSKRLTHRLRADLFAANAHIAANDEHHTEAETTRRQSKLSHDLHKTLSSFRNGRERSRQGLWWSLIFLLLTPVTRLLGAMNDKMSFAARLGCVLCCAVLMTSAIGVYSTVQDFRQSYRPLVVEHLGRGNWEFTRSLSSNHAVLTPPTPTSKKTHAW